MRIVYVVINADTYSLFASAAGRTQVSCGSSYGPACPLIWMTGNAINWLTAITIRSDIRQEKVNDDKSVNT